MRRIIRRAAIAGAVMGATKGMTSRAVAGAAAPPAAPPAPVPAPIEASPAVVAQASFNVSSNPPGADIEIDGDFIGSTPSTLELNPGQHEITIRKKGFQPWIRKMKVTSGKMNISADLEPTH
ncbi:MAG: PEGA domain-containing protein [Silvibacterium sp.]